MDTTGAATKPRHRRTVTGLLLLGVLGAMTAAATIAWGVRPPDPLASGRLAYARKDWEHSLQQARARLRTQSNDPEALRLLARSAIRLGRDELGTTIYSDRIGIEGMETEDLFLLGLTIARQGQEELALQVWSKAAAEANDHPELLRSLAETLLRRQRIEEAAATAERLSRIKGWEAAGHLLAGTARASLGDHEAATAELQRGLENDPRTGAGSDSSTYQKLLVRSLLSLGRPVDADHWLQSLLEPEVKTTAASDREAHWLASRVALQKNQADRARDELEKSAGYRTDNPLEPEPAPFVGSARCAACHADIDRQHRQTRHARSFHRGSELLSLPRPDGPLADPDDPHASHEVVVDNGHLRVRTSASGRVFEAVVTYAFGTPDRYVTMVARDSQGGFRALRLSAFRDQNGIDWDRTSGDAGSEDPIENVRGQRIHVRDGVIRCLQCHVTNPRAFRDPAVAEYRPEANDPGIGCERCHGPGLHHLQAERLGLSDLAVVNIGPSSPHATTLCRDCHTVGDANEIDHSREAPIWVRSPGVTLTFSRCFSESGGAVSCLTCHDPHRDAQRSPAFYETRCLNCHQAAGTGHQHARTTCPVNPSSKCLACHMPKVPVPVLHTSLTDHYIRVHREDPKAPTSPR
jgi:tetratricopeptide (TPR) repeat protein